jgi:hypothetical protein
MARVTLRARLAVGETSMPIRSTPRLCAHCGRSLTPDQESVTLENAQTGELLLLHRACFEVAYRRADSPGHGDQRD